MTFAVHWTNSSLADGRIDIELYKLEQNNTIVNTNISATNLLVFDKTVVCGKYIAGFSSNDDAE